jgi:probable rRNA maturation factor
MTEVNNLTLFKIKKDFLIEVAETVLKGEGKEVDLSVALVSSRRMRKLNRDHRGKDYVTDVLSFEDEQAPEVVLCLKKIRKNAKINKLPFQEELVFCLIHGVLHISGYDHEISQSEETRMQEKEQYYLSKIFS